MHLLLTDTTQVISASTLLHSSIFAADYASHDPMAISVEILSSKKAASPLDTEGMRAMSLVVRGCNCNSAVFHGSQRKCHCDLYLSFHPALTLNYSVLPCRLGKHSSYFSWSPTNHWDHKIKDPTQHLTKLVLCVFCVPSQSNVIFARYILMSTFTVSWSSHISPNANRSNSGTPAVNSEGMQVWQEELTSWYRIKFTLK